MDDSTGSGRGRKLKKTRLVEGDWELVRTDQDWKGAGLSVGRADRLSGSEEAKILGDTDRTERHGEGEDTSNDTSRGG
jgi:hypothetical protein